MGPFSWRKPSREEQPGPPASKANVSILHKSMKKGRKRTVRPEEQLVGV